jgi:SAM-dependent methyltransferase
MTKRYDQSYFDRFYRHRHTRVHSYGEVRRRVSVAVALSEYFLRRQLRTVLDIGCGEGAWLGHLRALRPHVRYVGYDPSEYAVRRFGKSRNVRRAAFHDLPSIDLGQHDLVVCSDVMHYVGDDDLRAGIKAIANATSGVAYLEVLTREDDITGDLEGFIRRPAAWYRKLFAHAGLTFVGPYTWLGAAFPEVIAQLEQA